MKLIISGEHITKGDLIEIGQFLTGFFKHRKDVIYVDIAEGTQDMSKEECLKLIIKMFKDEPAYSTVIEVLRDSCEHFYMNKIKPEQGDRCYRCGGIKK